MFIPEPGAAPLLNLDAIGAASPDSPLSSTLTPV
jgi:hypothetical protein